MIRSKSLLCVPALTLGLLVACGGGESSASDGGAGTAVTPGADADAGADVTAEDFVVPEDVLSPAEAEAKAASEITPENADEEFEKLKRELDG